MSKKIYYINSSLLNVKSTCRLRLRRIMIDGYSSNLTFADLHFGTCWHKFRQELALTENPETSMVNALAKWGKNGDPIAKLKKGYLNKIFLLNAINNFRYRYQDHIEGIEEFYYARDNEGKRLVECKFSIPLYSSDEFDLMGVGTLDAVGMINDTAIIMDDKTTSFYDSIEFFRKFETSVQMQFYTWALAKIAKEKPESVIGRLINSKPGFGIAIFGVFYNEKTVNFRRSDIITFSQSQREIFEFALKAKINEIVDIIKTFHIDPKWMVRDGFVNGSCRMYGAVECEFLNACYSGELEEGILSSNFTKREYNPLLTNEEL